MAGISRWRFASFQLDVENACLWHGTEPLPLRPKTFAVLHYLVTHTGQLVTKEALLEAVWPGTTVGDGVLKGCLYELRRVLQDPPAAPRFIATVPRRGYRFVAPVMAHTEAEQSPPGREPPAVPEPDPAQPAVTTMSEPPAEEEAVAGPRPTAQPSPTAERRHLTVLFCDLVDSTRMAEDLDPEDYREVVQAYHQTCAEVIARFEGYLAQYLGDGVLGYFGYPVAHEDDAQRAVRAGLGIIQALAVPSFARLLPAGGGLAVRLGVHTGLVVVGEVGDDLRHAPLALGATPNLAARLQALAAPNTLLISATTLPLLGGFFSCQSLGTPSLKGRTQPLEVYQVLEETTARSRLEAAGRTGLTPLIGREQEMELLRDRWAQVKDGAGQVVLLSGEAGIGKSRLVRALQEQVAAEPQTWLTPCQCSPYHQHSALYPLLDMLERKALHIDRETPAEQKLRTLEGYLGQHGLPLAETVPLLAPLLSLPLPDAYTPATLEPAHQKQQILRAFVSILLRLAAQRPVLLVMEDIHWADPSTLEFLSLLVDQGPTARMLTLLTCRPDFQPSWAPRSHCTQLTLQRLPRSQAASMLTKLTQGKTLPPEVVEQIVAKTDGVPLFVEELTKMVLESGLLQEQGTRYELVGPLPPLAIPPTLHDALVARLDRLAPVKGLAQLGATLGREFSYVLLRAVAPWDEESVQHGLHQLVATEFLYQQGLPPQATYRFKHALIQDAAYQSLLKSTRQQYHQRIARALESQFPHLAAAQPEMLAHHYTEAGLTAQAVDAWQQAGQLARRRSANQEAAAHLTLALQLLTTLPETPVRDRQELDLQMALGPALIAIHGPATPEVERAYARAHTLCAQLADTPQLFPTLRGLAWFYMNRGPLTTARQLAQQLLQLARREAAPDPLLVAHAVLGGTYFHLGAYATAREHLEQGIARIDPAQQQTLALHYSLAPGVICLSYAAHTFWCLGYPDQALRYQQEALTCAQGLSHPHSLAYTQQWAIQLHYLRREVAALQAQVADCLALGTQHGLPLYQGYATCWQGWADAMQGRGESGMLQIRQGLDNLLALRMTLSQPLCQVLLAEVLGTIGQTAAGLRLLAEALAAFHTSGRSDLLAETYRLQGALLLRQPIPQPDQAEACFQQALRIARQQQAKSWELRAATSLALLWQQQDQRQAARELLAPVYAWFTEGFDTTDLQEAWALLDSLEWSQEE